jgi:dTDP-4-amino-4,6-dideoxygalactose transaminase
LNNIEFIDLQAQRRHLGARIDEAMRRVLNHGCFIMGPEIEELEAQLSTFGTSERAVSCASGTDALLLPLMAWKIGLNGGGRRDAVFTPSFTFASTAEMVALAGATPVFVDVRSDTFNMNPSQLQLAVEEVKAKGELTPRAVIAVDLFGQMADYPALKDICRSHGLKLVSDAAQAFGGTLCGKQAGHWADCVTTSFFPAKPLGCYGDGGAVLTNDPDLAGIMESLRIHGKGSDKYDNVRVGLNGRMDTLQAAILIEKLQIFAEEIVERNKIAARYGEALGPVVTAPFVVESAVSTWAQYTLIVDKRDEMQSALKMRGVPSAVYYPKPLHHQTAYRDFPVGGNGLPVSEHLSRKVLSLPMHPYMDKETQDYIIESVIQIAVERNESTDETRIETGYDQSRVHPKSRKQGGGDCRHRPGICRPAAGDGV